METSQLTDVPITQSHIDFYRENGFVQVDNMLTPDELAELRTYLEEAMLTEGDRSVNTDKAGGLYYRVLNQKVNLWRDHASQLHVPQWIDFPLRACQRHRQTQARACHYLHAGRHHV